MTEQSKREPITPTSKDFCWICYAPKRFVGTRDYGDYYELEWACTKCNGENIKRIYKPDGEVYENTIRDKLSLSRW